MHTTDLTRAQHQLIVDQLLNDLHERRRHLYRLQAAGVQRAGMRTPKSDLHAVRQQLRDAIGRLA